MSDDITARLLELVRKRDASAEARVSTTFGRDGNTRFAAGEITTAGDTDITDVSLMVTLGQRHAAASTSQTDAASLSSLVDRALAMAKLAPEDPEIMPVLGPQKYATGASAWDDATARYPNAERAAAARTTIAAADKQSAIPAGFFEVGAREHRLATSAGLSASHKSTVASLTMTVRTPDGTGSGWSGAESTRAPALDAATLAGTAIDKAVRSREPHALEPGKYSVVLEPQAVSDLLEYLLYALDARSADEGRSFFSKRGGTKLGEKLFAPMVTLRSDPLNDRTPGSPFDGEGLPLGPVTWIDEGRLGALAYSRYWAHKQGKKPTGAHSSFELSGGSASSVDELIKHVKRGLLVTRFWYIRSLEPRELSVTGLTRDGVFLIENGKIAHPVNNFRFNDSPARVLAACQGMTKDSVRVPSYGGVVRVPALLADGFNMASVSKAV